jgi:hypothetical protein
MSSVNVTWYRCKETGTDCVMPNNGIFLTFQYQRVPQNGGTHKEQNCNFSTVCSNILLLFKKIETPKLFYRSP